MILLNIIEMFWKYENWDGNFICREDNVMWISLQLHFLKNFQFTDGCFACSFTHLTEDLTTLEIVIFHYEYTIDRISVVQVVDEVSLGQVDRNLA